MVDWKVEVNPASKKSNGYDLPGKDSSSKKSGVLSMAINNIAAMRIQSAFRAFMKHVLSLSCILKTRKARGRLKETVQLTTLIEADSGRKQASATLNHINSWSRIQDQIRARRFYMVTEGRLRQKNLENQLKLEAKLQQIEVEWCGGGETMEEIISKIYKREEAAVKRERAMAYAFSHQWRANSGQCFGQAYYDLGKESWGWSWKERWIAVRPWESRVHTKVIVPKKDQNHQANKGGEPNSSNVKATTNATKQAPRKENSEVEAKASKTEA
ncbi:hypothetical protein Acr_17g0010320 [Actinidia rufa]|uniref:Uncharacterized protein n=1 Tax=Actinidia rufa TaxID=165716 RepID=A0A7J0G3V5_9ERIC|nr:hypothetical protein Acr_17g0010320 [Actinidia rufa]